MEQQVLIELSNLHIKLRCTVSAKPVCMIQEISLCTNFKVIYLSAVSMELEQQVFIELSNLHIKLRCTVSAKAVCMIQEIQYEPSYYAGCIIAFDKENINCLSILLLSKEK